MEIKNFTNYDGTVRPSYFKRLARISLEGNWAKAMLIALVILIFNTFIPLAVNVLAYFNYISYAAEPTFLSYLINMEEASASIVPYWHVAEWGAMFITSAISFWAMLAFLDLYRKNPNWAKVEYKESFLKFVGLAIIYTIFLFLWTLLLIIPGIIKSLSYAQAFFILKDNPNMPIMDAILESQKMMRGHKLELFWLYMSFLGWIVLSIFTFGLLLLYVYPYIYASSAAYYETLKLKSVQVAE